MDILNKEVLHGRKIPSLTMLGTRLTLRESTRMNRITKTTSSKAVSLIISMIPLQLTPFAYVLGDFLDQHQLQW